MFGAEFVIPTNRNDLRESVGSHQYCVNDVLTSREITNEIQECQSLFKEKGPCFILDKFDVFYSVISGFSELHENVKEDAWHIILKSCKQFRSELTFVLDDSDLDSEKKNDLRSTLKMLVYIMCQFAEKFEDVATRPTTESVVAGKRGRKKASKKQSNWEIEREVMVEVFSELCQQPFHVLWDPPVVEDEFVCLVTNCCYKLLENPSIIYNKLVQSCIFQLLGHMIRKHSHTIGCSLKIIQLVQQHEHLTTALAEGVTIFVEEFGAKNIVGEILRELGQMDSKDMSRDTAGARSMAAFLLDLAKNMPSHILSNMSLVLLHLEQESYTLRNSVLAMIAEVVLKLLSGDHLETKDRKTRDQLLDHLEEHIHDVHAFVRSRVLQLWLRLVQEKAVPLPRQRFVLKDAIGRLHDKSSIVRRHASDLVTAFVQSNPFAAKLTVDELKENYEQALAKLKELVASEEPMESLKKAENEADTDESDNSTEKDKDSVEDENEDCDERTIPDNQKQLPDEGTPQSLENPTEAAKQQIVVQYLEETIEFAELIDQAIPIMCQLLGSKHNSDVLSAIEFFVAATEFGMAAAIRGVRQMLLLIWSQEQNIKDAVVAAYQRLYLQPNISCRRTKAINVVKNLSNLAIGATLGELTSLESLVSELVKTDQLNVDVLQVLWELVTKKLPNSTVDDRRMAILLLAFAAGAKKDIILSNIEVLVDAGLGKEAEEDLRLPAETCTSLLKLADRKPSTESLEPPPRFPSDHIIFTRLVEILVIGVRRIDDKFWTPLMEKATSLIYLLADHPDTICGDLLKKLSIVLQDVDDAEDEESAEAIAELKSPILSRLLAAAGQVAFCHLTYLDVHAFSEIKRRQFVQEEKAKKKSKRPTNARRSMGTSTSASALTTPRSTANGENEGGDDELGLAGATADDTEAEYIRNICDKDMVTGQNLLAIFSPVIIEVCSNPNKYHNPDLVAAATLALCKFMLVSADFCEDNLQLLFTIMEKSPEAVIRGNTVIAMGDLAFRFPNMIDPWTSHLYARLRDSSEKVRQSTLTVLTHLILNDMIKVKGQISDMAICVVDESEHISGLAKLFFQELGKKDNAIYNILPDVISRLSDPEIGTEEEKFRTILKFLIAFVRKDRQSESLVEKLCQRFRATRTDRQARDLAYCLSQLSFHHKSILKLQENFNCFADKLADQFICDCFTSILNGAKKLAKPETKTVIEDLEEKIAVAKEKGLEEEAIVSNANKATRQLENSDETPRRATKTPGRKAKASTASKRGTGRKDSNKDADEKFGKHLPKTPSRQTAVVFSDNSDSSEEHTAEKELPQQPVASRNTRSQGSTLASEKLLSSAKTSRTSLETDQDRQTDAISAQRKSITRSSTSDVLEDKPPVAAAPRRSSRRLNQSSDVDTSAVNGNESLKLDESGISSSKRPLRQTRAKGDKIMNNSSSVSSTQSKRTSRRRPLSQSSNDSDAEIGGNDKSDLTPGPRRSARRR